MTNNAPPLGYEILTSDGHLIGEVKEVEGDRFKVDAPLKRDYWLHSGAISEITGTTLRLHYTLEDVGAMKEDVPHAREEESGNE